MEAVPGAGNSMALRVEFLHREGALGTVLTAVGDVRGMVGAVDIVRMQDNRSVRDIMVNTRSSRHGRRIVEAVEALPETRVINVSDRTFLMHLGGKVEVKPKMPVRTRDVLSMAYTPGVARVCRAIVEEPERAFNLTIKRNTVAVVSRRDGGSRLGGHRSSAGDVRNGGQGHALQKVRRGRCFPHLSQHQKHR